MANKDNDVDLKTANKQLFSANIKLHNELADWKEKYQDLHREHIKLQKRLENQKVGRINVRK